MYYPLAASFVTTDTTDLRPIFLISQLKFEMVKPHVFRFSARGVVHGKIKLTRVYLPMYEHQSAQILIYLQ